MSAVVPLVGAPAAHAATTNALRLWTDDGSAATPVAPIDASEPDYVFGAFAGWSSDITVQVTQAGSWRGLTLEIKPPAGRELAQGDLVVNNGRSYGATAGTGGSVTVGQSLVDLTCTETAIVSARIDELAVDPDNTAVTALTVTWGVECGTTSMHGTVLWHSTGVLRARTSLFANGPTHAAATSDATVSGVLSGPSGPLAGRTLKVTRIDDRGMVSVPGVVTGADGSWSLPAQFWLSDASYTVELLGDDTLARSLAVRLISRDKVRSAIRILPTPVTRVGDIVHVRGALLTMIGVGTPTRLSLFVGYTQGGFLSKNVYTDADGSFDIALVQHDTDMTFQLSLSGHPYFLDSSGLVHVKGYETASAITLVAPTTATRGVAFRVTGRLTTGGVSLPATQVQVRWGDNAGGGMVYAVTASDGTFSARIVPTVGGELRLVADFLGLPGRLPTDSGLRYVTVSRLSTTISITSDRTIYTKGTRARLTIRLGRTYNGRYVHVKVRPTALVGEKHNTLIASVWVPATGAITISYPVKGNVTFTAGYLGDDRYLPIRAAVSVRAV